LVGSAVEHLVVFLMRETMADESQLWQHTQGERGRHSCSIHVHLKPYNKSSVKPLLPKKGNYFILL